MRKWILRWVLPMLLLLPLGGCWSYSELDERAIIAGAAIDRMESGALRLTVETVSFSDAQAPGAKSEVLTGQGGSIAEAIFDIMNQSQKDLYWYHATLLVLDQEYAREGIRELVDYILNEHEMRLTLTMAVSRLETAAEVLSLESHGSQIRSFAIAGIIEEQSRLGKTVRTDAYEVINTLLEPGVEFALPQIMSTKKEKKEAVDISGCGIFHDDRLTGWLDAEETRFVQLVTGDVRQAELDLVVSDGRASLSAYDWKVDAKPQIVDGSLHTDITVRVKYDILMIDGSLNVEEDQGLAKLESSFHQYIESNLRDTVQQLQQTDSDVLGWGKKIWQKDPTLYRSLGSWYETFDTVKMTVRTDFQIDHGWTALQRQIGG